MGGVHGIDEGMVPDAIRPASRRPKGAASSQPGATPRVKPARGNAPGSRAQATKALKGRATHGMLAKTTVWFALSGLGSIGGGQPGALPRAGMGRAVGASSHARRRMSESMACLGDLPNTLPGSTENVEEPFLNPRVSPHAALPEGGSSGLSSRLRGFVDVGAKCTENQRFEIHCRWQADGARQGGCGRRSRMTPAICWRSTSALGHRARRRKNDWRR